MFTRLTSIAIISIAISFTPSDASVIRGGSHRLATRRNLQGGFFTGGAEEQDSTPNTSPVSSPSVEESEKETPQAFGKKGDKDEDDSDDTEGGDPLVVEPNANGDEDENDDNGCDDSDDSEEKSDDNGGKGDKGGKGGSKDDKKDDKKDKKCKDKKGDSSDEEEEEDSLQVAGNLEVDDEGNVIVYDENGNVLSDAESSASATFMLSWSVSIVSVAWTLMYSTGVGAVVFLTSF